MLHLQIGVGLEEANAVAQWEILSRLVWHFYEQCIFQAFSKRAFQSFFRVVSVLKANQCSVRLHFSFPLFTIKKKKKKINRCPKYHGLWRMGRSGEVLWWFTFYTVFVFSKVVRYESLNAQSNATQVALARFLSAQFYTKNQIAPLTVSITQRSNQRNSGSSRARVCFIGSLRSRRRAARAWLNEWLASLATILTIFPHLHRTNAE